MEGLFLLSQLDGLSIIWSKTPRSQYFKAEIDHIRPEWIFVLWLWKWKKKMKRGHFLLHFASVCNDIPLESKEVPIRRKGKEWRLVIHGPAKRWRMPSSFRSLCYYYFIFDVATKRIPLKGCFYVPDVLLRVEPASTEDANNNWPSCNKPFFPWEK